MQNSRPRAYICACTHCLMSDTGTLQESFRFAEFCGQYRGSLSLGQEQDSVGGTFDANQSPAMILDTVAVYSRAWSQDKVEQREDSPCVNLGDADLYALFVRTARFIVFGSLSCPTRLMNSFILCLQVHRFFPWQGPCGQSRRVGDRVRDLNPWPGLD